MHLLRAQGGPGDGAGGLIGAGGREERTLSAARIGIAGAAVVGVAFGMARYVYGLTLPDIRRDLGLPELVLGLVASATFVGYLAGLLLAGPLTARRGPRAPTTVGGVCGALGAAIVVTPSRRGCSRWARFWPAARAAGSGRRTRTSSPGR